MNLLINLLTKKLKLIIGIFISAGISFYVYKLKHVPAENLLNKNGETIFRNSFKDFEYLYKATLKDGTTVDHMLLGKINKFKQRSSVMITFQDMNYPVNEKQVEEKYQAFKKGREDFAKKYGFTIKSFLGVDNKLKKEGGSYFSYGFEQFDPQKRLVTQYYYYMKCKEDLFMTVSYYIPFGSDKREFKDFIESFKSCNDV